MSVPVEFSLIVDLTPERRLEIERAVEVEHVDVEKSTEEQARKQEAVCHHEGLSEQHTSTLDTNRSLSRASQATTTYAPKPSAVGVARSTVDEVSILPRLGRWQRTKEFFRPGLRNKRIAEEFAAAERLTPNVEDPVEQPLLLVNGLLRLKEYEGKQLPAKSIGEEFDMDMMQEEGHNEITALPSLLSIQQSRSGPRVAVDPEEEADEPSVDEIADKAMEEAIAAADSPGNRRSTRLPLPAEWVANKPESSKAASIGAMQQAPAPYYMTLLFLPDLSSPGLPLPNLSVPGVRPAKARGEVDEASSGVA